MGIMGANIADVDNDGFLDLYFGTGDPDIGRMEPDRFFRNVGGEDFEDLTFVTGLGNRGKGHGITFVDLDGDGDLDIYAPEGGFVHGDTWANAFYENRQEIGHHWLHVDLVGSKVNRDAVGARLTVLAGDLQMLRCVQNGEGFGSSNSATVEFGLGKHAKVEHLEVHWPGGVTQTFTDIPADQRIVIQEGEPWKPWSRG
jgi:hypothetical protein